jgi:biopolymer transport protein ExbD
MSVTVECPHCGTLVEIPSALAGREAACGACGERFRVEAPPPPAEPEDAEKPFHFETGPRKLEAEADMDMTPMVDVTFLLLIFFMVTASFALQRSIAVPKPENEEPSSQATTIEDIEDDPDFITVRVDSLSNYLVIGPDDEYPIVSKQDLLAKLHDLRDADPPPVALMVIAHGDALHEKVVAALDCGTAIGIERVMLQTTEEEE